MPINHQLILDNCLDIICTISDEGKFISMNKSCVTILGYQPEELIGRVYSDFIFLEDQAKSISEAEEIIEGKQTKSFQNRYYHKNGHLVDLVWSSVFVPEEKLFVCIAKDATEIVLNQERIKKSEVFYKTLFEKNPLPMALWDLETLKFIDCNLETLKKYNYKKEEFINLPILELIPEEDLDIVVADLNIIREQKKLSYKLCRHKKKSGELLNVEVYGHIIDVNDRPTAFVMFNDITEKKQNEEKLAASEFKFRAFFENSTNPILLSDIDGNIIEVNKATCAKFQLTEDELIGQDLKILIAPSFHSEFNAQSGKIKLAKADKTTFDCEYNVINFSDVGGRPRCYTIISDISEKELYQLALEESNLRFEYSTKATSELIWDMDLLTNNIFWGANFEKIFGHPQTIDNITIAFWKSNVHPDDSLKVHKKFQELINGSGLNWRYTYRYKRQDGSWAVLRDNGFVIRDENGKAVRVIGSLRDITDSRHEEERLKLLESVILNTNDSVLITEAEPFDEPGPRIIYVNDAFCRMTGYAKEEVIGKSPRILQGELSDKEALKELGRALRNWETHEITTINYKKNGEPFWINFTVTPVADETGWYTHWIAIERDVTAQKETEKQIKSTLREKNDILLSIKDAFFAVDKSWVVTYANAQAEGLFDSTGKSMLGQYIWNILPNHIHSDNFKYFHDARDELKVITFEEHFEKIDEYYEVSIYPSSNSGLSVYLKDISERVKYTKDIEEKNRKLADIANLQSHVVRAPLARILGLTNLLKDTNLINNESAELLSYLQISSQELDEVIKDIVKKTEHS